MAILVAGNDRVATAADSPDSASADVAQPAGDSDEAAARAKLQETEVAIQHGQQHLAALEKQAAQLAAEIATDQKASVAAAHSAQLLEARITILEGQSRDIGQRIAVSRTTLENHRHEQAASLAALQRIAVEPPIALAFSPGSPIDSLRSAMLLGAIVPRLREEAKALAIEIAALDDLRAQADRNRIDLAEQETELLVERQHLATLMRDKQKAEATDRAEAAAEAKQAAQFAAQASDLQDLIDRLEQARLAREQAAQEAEARREAAALKGAAGSHGGSHITELVSPAVIDRPAGGHLRSFIPGSTALVAPVTGRIARAYGSSDGFVTSRGLTVRTRPGAEVVTPFDGQVLFAGAFRSYGQILIIDHGGGYASLLAGLGHLDATVGQHVVVGEPVGTMSSAAASPELYFELRRKDQPIDPLPWLGSH